jgi:polysaccharide chain length determinant protein (PEP-CTERM system associated)
MDEENTKTLEDYIHIVRRRIHVIVIPMLFLLMASLLVAILLPAIFRSEATIMIEQQQIPVDLVKSTVVSFADERISNIQQKLMTVNNIKNIINKNSLYLKERKKLSDADLANLFRSNTSVDLVTADVISGKQNRASKATIAFKIAFSNENPIIAHAIANELTTLFLDENIKNRTQKAVETATFLDEEAEKFKKNIQLTENKIADYKEKYSDSLPELLAVNLAAIERIENSISQLALQEKMISERRINLQTQLLATSPVEKDLTKDTDNKDPDTLPALQEKYNQLLSKYSDSHPDVKALKRKIDNFKEPTVDTKGTNVTNPVYLQLKGELDVSAVELQSIAEQRKKFAANLKVLEARVSQTHQVERGYDELMRDLESNKTKYQELTSKYQEAKLSQTLEEEQKAEKFSILEPARVPLKPEKPNRIKILFIGFCFSIAAGLSLGFLIEFTDGTIHGYKELKKLTGIEPLVIIPYIENSDDIKIKRRINIQYIMLVSFILVVMVLSVHFIYMPLDMLINKLLHNLSFI